MEPQFMKLKPDQNQLLTVFDYDSIMLYGSYTFSKDRKKLMTMVGKNNRFLKDVIIKYKMSASDIHRIKMLYNCPWRAGVWSRTPDDWKKKKSFHPTHDLYCDYLINASEIVYFFFFFFSMSAEFFSLLLEETELTLSEPVYY